MTTATTSWDDGAPQDERLADLLARHGVQGTFYIPRTNQEGRPVLPDSSLRRIAQRFEIGGHTHDHVFLNTVDPQVAQRQIIDGKSALQDAVGSSLNGFCYPRGYHDSDVRNWVRQAGFSYARTTVNLFCDLTWSDPFQMPTSLHFYPRAGYRYAKTYLRFMHYRHRWPPFITVLQSGALVDQLKRLIDHCAAHNGYFHLWGHSWEIDELGLWNELDQVLSHLAATFSSEHLVDNHGVHRQHLSLRRGETELV